MAMRYGTVPIVHETGGLKDSVRAYKDFDGIGDGFAFSDYQAKDLYLAISEAVKLYFGDEAMFDRLRVRCSPPRRASRPSRITVAFPVLRTSLWRSVRAPALPRISTAPSGNKKHTRSPARTGLNGDIHQIAARNVVFMTRIVWLSRCTPIHIMVQ